MDPIPYILGAYVLGLVCVGGFTAWIMIDRRRLRHMTHSLRDRT